MYPQNGVIANPPTLGRAPNQETSIDVMGLFKTVSLDMNKPTVYEGQDDIKPVWHARNDTERK
jgi:hypothetical protein